MKTTTQTPRQALRRRALILFPGALGDFICFLPALQAVSDDFCVDLLARSEFADLAPPRVSAASLERYEVRRLFGAGARDDERVRDFFAAYAAIFSWTGSQSSEFMRQLASVSEGRAKVFPFRPKDRKEHQRDYYLACLDASNVNAPPPAISLRAQAVAWCDHFWREHGLQRAGILVVAPGSGAAEKNWPIAYYRSVATWWRRTTQGKVILLSGPVEEERGGLEPLAESCEYARNLGLAQVAALLARSDVYLGNDSGVTHLAAAVGVRTAALFGPTNALEWAPRGERVTIIRRRVACSPCESDVMKCCSHRECLTAFRAREVIGELQKLPEVATLTRGVAGIRV